MEKPKITRINGGFEIVANSTKKENNGFFLPVLNTEQKDGIQQKIGALIVHLDTYKVYENGKWYTLNKSLDTVSGEGLAPGSSPVVLPTGVKASVEVAGNELGGFIYYDAANAVNRTYVNGAWKTVATV